MTGIGLAVHGVWATGFIGMRLTWAWSPRRSSAIASASAVGVVHAADHRDLVGDPPAGRAGVVAGRRDDLGDRPAPVERDEHVAERIARGVEGDRQRELRPERGQPADARHDARRGDVMWRAPRPNRRRVVERVDRLEHAVEVEQRLAHAHEHDVGQALARRPRGGAPRGGPGRRSRRSRGRGRSRARRSRRTGSRPRSRPGSRCTACAARAGRPGPGSASGPIRSSAPSDSRWSAFSVRPPSDETELRVGDGVEAERGVELGAERPAGRVRIARASRGMAVPQRVGDLAGAVGRLRRAAANQAASASGSRPDRPGRGSRSGPAVGSGVLAGAPLEEASVTAALSHGDRDRPRPRTGAEDGAAQSPVGPPASARPRPRRNSTEDMGRPPAGWTSSRRRRPSAVMRTSPRPSAASPPGTSPRSGSRPRRRGPRAGRPAVSRKEPGHGR